MAGTVELATETLKLLHLENHTKLSNELEGLKAALSKKEEQIKIFEGCPSVSKEGTSMRVETSTGFLVMRVQKEHPPKVVRFKHQQGQKSIHCRTLLSNTWQVLSPTWTRF